MKTAMLASIGLCILIAGCGERMSNPAREDADSQLTAADLAQLMDLHAWKVSLPKGPKL